MKTEIHCTPGSTLGLQAQPTIETARSATQSNPRLTAAKRRMAIKRMANKRVQARIFSCDEGAEANAATVPLAVTVNQSKMKTLIERNHDAREAVGQRLNLQLADEYLLYMITRDYNWNVTGPDFFSLRLQFQLQHNDAARWVDDLSEWIRNLQLNARISWAELVESARSSAAPGLGLPAHRMLAELLDTHDGIIARLRTDSDDCLNLFGDAATAGFLTGLREQHENAAWMLRAQLETAKTI